MSSKAKNRPPAKPRNEWANISCDSLFKLRWAVHVHCLGLNQSIGISEKNMEKPGKSDIVSMNGEALTHTDNEHEKNFIEVTTQQLRLYVKMEEQFTEELVRRRVMSTDLTPDQMMEAGADYDWKHWGMAKPNFNGAN